MKYKTIDFKKLSREIYARENKIRGWRYLKNIWDGVAKSAIGLALIKKHALYDNDIILHEFAVDDYQKLSEDVSRSLGKPFSKSEVKKIDNGTKANPTVFDVIYKLRSLEA